MRSGRCIGTLRGSLVQSTGRGIVERAHRRAIRRSMPVVGGLLGLSTIVACAAAQMAPDPGPTVASRSAGQWTMPAKNY